MYTASLAGASWQAIRHELQSAVHAQHMRTRHRGGQEDAGLLASDERRDGNRGPKRVHAMCMAGREQDAPAGGANCRRQLGASQLRSPAANVALNAWSVVVAARQHLLPRRVQVQGVLVLRPGRGARGGWLRVRQPTPLSRSSSSLAAGHCRQGRRAAGQQDLPTAAARRDASSRSNPC